MRTTALIALLLIAACKEEEAKAPPPVDMTDTALSYFCQMNIAEHGGPKGQIHLDGMPAPLFFAQVRDLMAYLKSPERDARITAIYVSDMGAAKSWDEPGESNWINADSAIFVVDAGVAGGMGAPEIVPFSDPSKADEFITRYGGKTFSLTDVPDDAAIGYVEPDAQLETPS